MILRIISWLTNNWLLAAIIYTILFTKVLNTDGIVGFKIFAGILWVLGVLFWHHLNDEE